MQSLDFSNPAPGMMSSSPWKGGVQGLEVCCPGAGCDAKVKVLGCNS